MLLDKEIRAKIVEILKADAGVTALVDVENIHNFPSFKIDMNFTPAISVFTLGTSDSSEVNDAEHENMLTVHIEVTSREMDLGDDVENAVDQALVQDIVWGDSFGGIADLQPPYFSANEVNYDDEGNGLRISKNTIYMLKYRTLKGKVTPIEELLQINGDMIYENDPESQLDNKIEIIY